MTFEYWINDLIRNNKICGIYSEKVHGAISNVKLMDIAMDSNGISFLPEASLEGYALPYDVICSRFRNYINGKYIAEFKNSKGNGYNSSIYCCYNGTITTNTTLICLLGCHCNIELNDSDFIRIYCDSNTNLHITGNGKAIIETYGDTGIVYTKDSDIEIINHKHG